MMSTLKFHPLWVTLYSVQCTLYKRKTDRYQQLFCKDTWIIRKFNRKKKSWKNMKIG